MPNFNEVAVKEPNTITSLEVAEMLGKEHKLVIRDIEGTDKTVGIIPVLIRENFTLSDYFTESKYKDSAGRTQKCYLVTKMGCEMLGNKQQGEKGILFTAKYVKRFNEMEDVIKDNIAIQTVDTKSKEVDAKLINAKVRAANVYMKIADNVNIPEYQQICYSKATEVLNDGHALLPLPKTERRTYSATEIGEKLGISSNRVGTLANKHNLKTKEYGIEVWDKSKYSSKQVATWRYYDNVISVLEGILKQNGDVK